MVEVVKYESQDLLDAEHHEEHKEVHVLRKVYVSTVQQPERKGHLHIT